MRITLTSDEKSLLDQAVRHMNLRLPVETMVLKCPWCGEMNNPAALQIRGGKWCCKRFKDGVLKILGTLDNEIVKRFSPPEAN